MIKLKKAHNAVDVLIKRYEAQTIQMPISNNLIDTGVLTLSERYAGIITEQSGKLAYHLILLSDEISSINWSEAIGWVHNIGGELPTRREQSQLFANLQKFNPK